MRISVQYNNLTFSSSINHEDSKFKVNCLEEVPAVLPCGYKVIQNEKEILLMEERKRFDFKDGIGIFSDALSRQIFSYNKDTDTFGDFTENKYISFKDDVFSYVDKNTGRWNNFGGDSLMMCYIIDFLGEVICHINPYLGSKLKSSTEARIYSNEKIATNLYNIATKEKSNAAEKILSAMGMVYFSGKLDSDEGLNISGNNGKLKQIIGLPNSVLNMLKSYPSHASLESDFRKICTDDPNEGIFICDYVEKLKNIKTFGFSENQVPSFIGMLREIKEKIPSIKVADVIKKVIKQRVYFDISEPFNKCKYVFDLPFEELQMYRDYINLTDGKGVLFPRDLRLAHNVAARNAKIVMDKELCEKFEEKVKSFEEYCYEEKEYVISYPKTVQDIVDEGNALEHCLATYATMIANGSSRVFYLRKSDAKDTSFVTLEVDEDFNFTQIKQKYDVDVTDKEILEFLKKWRKWVKSK